MIQSMIKACLEISELKYYIDIKKWIILPSQFYLIVGNSQNISMWTCMYTKGQI